MVDPKPLTSDPMKGGRKNSAQYWLIPRTPKQRKKPACWKDERVGGWRKKAIYATASCLESIIEHKAKTESNRFLFAIEKEECTILPLVE